MKNLYILVLTLLISTQLEAQSLQGKVIDLSSGLSVPNAIVKIGNHQLLVNENGFFNLNTSSSEDSLKVQALGYKTYHGLLSSFNLKDTLKIYLVQSSFLMNEVTVKGFKNYHKDSLNIRNEFQSVFNHKAPTFDKLYVKKDFFNRSQIKRGQSANSILSVDLLQVLSLITDNNKPITKLQETLEKQENQNYIDQQFSKTRIQQLTPLQGDSLTIFIFKYRPTRQRIEKMTDYDLNLYIKDAYQEFLKKEND
ncbi:MAG: hypothetical protein ABIP95_11430 [Pelobium sp.]